KSAGASKQCHRSARIVDRAEQVDALVDHIGNDAAQEDERLARLSDRSTAAAQRDSAANRQRATGALQQVEILTVARSVEPDRAAAAKRLRAVKTSIGASVARVAVETERTVQLHPPGHAQRAAALQCELTVDGHCG